MLDQLTTGAFIALLVIAISGGALFIGFWAAVVLVWAVKGPAAARQFIREEW
ncbi:hypothetical protein [Marinobacterium lutimaris]|uniref:Uncharacterized protein n=1 Tax=Marinobacterium lutimaris TaxID=568106 RepID=A0A1H5XPF7_9GAMM|nr:hypothetical protein [Marinobacterium lutimaris]SEG13385.1 hypothetical protein SAMN05444390_1011450 [Marinobacterium lutimaris]